MRLCIHALCNLSIGTQHDDLLLPTVFQKFGGHWIYFTHSGLNSIRPTTEDSVSVFFSPSGASADRYKFLVMSEARGEWGQ